MKKFLLVLVFFLIRIALPTLVLAADTDAVTYNIFLTVEQEIVAHSPQNLTIPNFTTGTGKTAAGTNNTGYFDSNGPTQIVYSGSGPGSAALPRLGREETDAAGAGIGTYDILPTYYKVLYIGHNALVGEWNEVANWTEAANLVNVTTNIRPHSGVINVEVQAKADVVWADDSGGYTTELVLTAVVSSY